jgi:hypothetical protein
MPTIVGTRVLPAAGVPTNGKLQRSKLQFTFVVLAAASDNFLGVVRARRGGGERVQHSWG